MADGLEVERHGPVLVVTIDREERMNALSQKLCAELPAAIHAADQSDDVRVVVITGAGGKAFSAGYDIKESAEAPKRTLTEWRERLNRDLVFTFAPWNCSKPVIAMIDGFCLAGALEFAQMCDIRYCSDTSKFGVVETRFSNGIATYIMPWILGNMRSTRSRHSPLPLHRKYPLLQLVRVRQNRAPRSRLPSPSRMDVLLF